MPKNRVIKRQAISFPPCFPKVGSHFFEKAYSLEDDSIIFPPYFIDGKVGIKTMKHVSLDQCKDTAILCCLLLVLFSLGRQQSQPVLKIAAAILFITLLNPSIFSPLARIWFGFSHYLGTVMTMLILSIVFYLIVSPIGLIRRLFGADPMKIDPKNRTEASAFINRNHCYNRSDLQRPF